MDKTPIEYSSKWTKHSNLQGRTGYHIVCLYEPPHLMAISINHKLKRYKFFDPNEGILSSTKYEFLADALSLFSQGWGRWKIHSFFPQ